MRMIEAKAHHIHLGSGTVIDFAGTQALFVPDNLITKDGNGRPNEAGMEFWVSASPAYLEIEKPRDVLNR